MKMLVWMAMVSVLVAFGACKGSKQTQENTHATSKTATETPAKPVTAPPKAKTKAEAIAAGIDFLSKAPWELDFVYLYSYLQPRFQWPELPAQRQNTAILDSLQHNGDDRALRILDQMIMFERLRNPNYVLPQEKMKAAQEEDAFTVPALYCDRYALDTASYFPLLRQEIAAGDYRLSHALLAYLWLEEKQCFSQAELQAIRPRLIQENRALAERFPIWLDLKIEAAALLRAAGETLPEEWIQSLIDAQQMDGGWLGKPQDDVSSTHATILAIWLLALS